MSNFTQMISASQAASGLIGKFTGERSVEYVLDTTPYTRYSWNGRVMVAASGGQSDASPAGAAYMKSPGEVILDMSAIGANFTKTGSGGGVGTQTVSAKNYWPGSTAVDMTNANTGSGSSVTWARAVSVAALGAAPNMVVPVNFNDFTLINTFTIDVSMGDATFTNFFRFVTGIGSGGSGRLKQNGWQLVSCASTEWVVGGGAPDWSAMSIGSIRFTWLNGSASVVTILAIDDMIFNRHAKAKLLLYFDFGYISQYTVARPILNALGLKATIAVTPGVLGTDPNTYASVSQLQEWVNDGHAVVCRPAAGFGGQSIANCMTLAAAAQDYLRANFGMAGIRGALHIVYNQGQYWPASGGALSSATAELPPNTVVNAIGDRTLVNRLQAELGFVTGRSTETTNFPDHMRLGCVSAAGIYPPNLMTHGIIGFYGGTTLAGFQTGIDNAISRGSAIALFMHTLQAANADATTPEAFRLICEYAASKRAAGLLDVMNVPDFYAGL